MYTGCISPNLLLYLVVIKKEKIILGIDPGTNVLGYGIMSACEVSHNDYIIRLDSSTNLVLSTYVYSKVLQRKVGITEGLKGTELIFE